MHPNLRMTPGQLIPEARTMQNASRGPKAKEKVNQNSPQVTAIETWMVNPCPLASCLRHSQCRGCKHAWIHTCFSCAIVASFLAATKQNPRQKHDMLLTFENQKEKSGQRWKIVDPGTHVRPPHIEQLWNASGPVSCGLYVSLRIIV